MKERARGRERERDGERKKTRRKEGREESRKERKKEKRKTGMQKERHTDTGTQARMEQRCFNDFSVSIYRL